MAEVHAGYAQRLADERAKEAAMGSETLARRDEFLLPVGTSIELSVGWPAGNPKPQERRRGPSADRPALAGDPAPCKLARP